MIQKETKLDWVKKLGIKVDDYGRTQINIDTLKRLKPMPVGNRYKEVIIKDNQCIGFRARCNSGGSVVYTYRYRPKGKSIDNKILEKQNITIGQWFNKDNPRDKDKIGMTPTVARKLANDMKIKIANKEDPYSIVKAKRTGRTFISVYDDWIKHRVNSANFKNSSRKNYKSRHKLYAKCKGSSEKHKRLYRKYIRVFKLFNTPMKNWNKDNYIEIHNVVTESSPYQANRFIEDLRLVEQYGIELGVINKRVCIFKEKEMNREIDRLDKTLPYDPIEMKRYRISGLNLVKKERSYLTPFMALHSTGLLGGRSKSMVFSMKWDQINRKEKTITFIDTKNNKPIILSYDYRFSAVLKIMEEVRKTINHRDKRYQYVFPAASKDYKTKHIRDPRKTHRSIIENAKIDYKCIHFLRHSWATNTYAATGDILAVKEMGGWLSLEAVQKYVTVTKKVREQRLAKTRKYLAQSHVS